MKGMKGKLMRKLKTVKQIGYLKPEKILQVSALDGFVDNINMKTSSFVDNLNNIKKPTFVENFNLKNLPFNTHKKPPLPKPKQTEIIDVDDLMKDLVEEGEEFDDKENRMITSFSLNGAKTEHFQEKVISGNFVSSSVEMKDGDCTDQCDGKDRPLKEVGLSGFRKPDMDSGTLFDPDLLSAFEEAVSEHIKAWEDAKEAQVKPIKENDHNPLSELEDDTDPLSEFEERCPPGGSDSVIFYTTSLRGIRKTFEDCQSIRFLLESFRVIYYERDVSVHSEFREEMWRTLGDRVVPPRLFIRGRYIGGAEHVLKLNEQGRFRPLFRDIPIDYSEGPCCGCSGFRFGLCFYCDGSRKVLNQDSNNGRGGNNGELWSVCTQCNENGLVVCPFCS